MKLTRQTQLLNLTIQINSAIQPVQGLPVIITSGETIHDAEGAMVGHTQHAQKFAIQSDMTPDMLATLNDALSYLGYELAPIGKK